MVKLHAAANTWEGRTRVTGGALKPSKCFWKMVRFEWREGRFFYEKRDKEENLTVKYNKGSRFSV